ncbi:hypothetical protein FRC12_021153 [Ceratobasidium sp. 428]|nr:hypothetical protein FRC12_021153 [Ceratobasidium sp. 428]
MTPAKHSSLRSKKSSDAQAPGTKHPVQDTPLLTIPSAIGSRRSHRLAQNANPTTPTQGLNRSASAVLPPVTKPTTPVNSTTGARPQVSRKRTFDVRLNTHDRQEIQTKRMRALSELSAKDKDVEDMVITTTSMYQQDKPATSDPLPLANALEELELLDQSRSMQPKHKVAVRSLNKRAKRALDKMLNQADITLYHANSLIIKCDGTYQDAIKNSLPKYDARLISDSAEKAGQSVEAWCDEHGYHLWDDLELIEMPDCPWTLVDCQGVPLVTNLPQYYTARDGAIFTEELLDLRNRLHARAHQADVNGQGDPDSYVQRNDPKHPVGCLNFGDWVSDGQIQQDESRPTSDSLGGGVQRFVDIQSHWDFIRPYTTLLNYGISRCYPESYKAHLQMRAALEERLPAVKAMATNNPNVMSGTSYIYNRRTRLHTDRKEGKRGISPLVVMGDCTTGYLALPRLRIKIKYLPRALVFIRGRLLDHKVMGWNGEGNRICLAHFNHETEWRNSECVADTKTLRRREDDDNKPWPSI